MEETITASKNNDKKLIKKKQNEMYKQNEMKHKKQSQERRPDRP
jgi:hypothetical protein